MKQLLLRRGKIDVADVPAPLVEPGSVLIRSHYSCISAGTELSGVRESAGPLWLRAMRQPSAALRVLEMAATSGIHRTSQIVRGLVEAGSPTGYSTAGVVAEVGDGVADLHPGMRVGCAGAQYAHHAEWVCVPRNLVVPVPDGLSLTAASTVTLGAIALQGVRRAQPTLGETFVVLGLGLLGQLTWQLLHAAGCRAIGVDLDRRRANLARKLGIDAIVDNDMGATSEQVVRLTDGIGADGVIITASTSSDSVVSTAFQMCRKKGRVVLVGDVGLQLNRADFYAKELDFFISTSYGPGRYDRRYEEEGLDYPVGYVRWTENRNMAEYLRQLVENRLQLQPLIEAEFPIAEAPAAYNAIQTERPETGRPLIVLLRYPAAEGDESVAERKVFNPLVTASSSSSARIRLALIGAGSFAKSMHLPNLRSLADRYELRAVVSRSGHNAVSAARQYAARYATTDTQEVLADPEIDAVLIATRHDHHASLTLAALAAGKHVMVEKPLGVSESEVNSIARWFEHRQADLKTPLLLTGFNRRFSPHIQRLKSLLQDHAQPMLLNYRMNAGRLPPDHWMFSAEGGGRNIGEACHVYDLFIHLTNSTVAEVGVELLRTTSDYYTSQDNFVATMRFANGSLATLTYTALGSTDYPKEQLEVFSDGKVLVLNDYRETSVHGAPARGLTTRLADKGHRQELIAFADTILCGGQWPNPLAEQLAAMQIAFYVEEQLRKDPRSPQHPGIIACRSSEGTIS